MYEFFENSGEKIQIAAAIFFGFEVLGSIIAGIALLGNSAGLGCALIFGGPFVAWLKNLCLYAFGEVVEDIADTRKNSEIIANLLNSVPTKSGESSLTIDGEDLPDL